MSTVSTASAITNISFSQIIPALKILLDAVMHRGELATCELGEARDYVLATLLFGVMAVALVLLGGFSATFTIAALVWDRPDRGLILGLMSLGYFIIAGVLVWVAARRLRTWHPLVETLTQLRKDQHCLQTILSPAPGHH